MKKFSVVGKPILVLALVISAASLLMWKMGGADATSCLTKGKKGDSSKGQTCCSGLAQILVAGSSTKFTCSDCGNGICDKGNGETHTTCPKDCPAACIKLNATGSTVNGASCCTGLSPISSTASSFVCTHCGNGKCEIHENLSNCPQDCHPACVKLNGTGIFSVNGATCCPGLLMIPASTSSSPYGAQLTNGPSQVDAAQGGTAQQAGPAQGGTAQQVVPASLTPGSPFVCTHCGNGHCETNENLSNCPQDCHPSCIKQNDSGSDSHGDLCCTGLYPIYNYHSDNFTCTKCGNKRCDTDFQSKENHENCPQDCHSKTPLTVSNYGFAPWDHCSTSKVRVFNAPGHPSESLKRMFITLSPKGDCRSGGDAEFQCEYCPDGYCDVQLQENACNCPQDCGGQ